jgi:hypothetical protein
MKWIFAFSQGSEAAYGDLIRVSVATARQNTSLEAFCLYDGDPTPLTRWISAQGITIVPCRSVFYEDLKELAQRKSNRAVLQIGSGAFLRLELPRIAREQGWNDQFIFYTDCDVMFLKDPEPLLAPLAPRFFCAAPETFRNKPLHMNTGVMWLRLAAIKRETEALIQFTRSHFEQIVDASWDQGALRVYFNPLHRQLWKWRVPDRLSYAVMTRMPFRPWKWDDLPLQLNWKPYWGENPAASVVHFHGLKPWHRAQNCQTLPFFLQTQWTPAFEYYCAQWDEFLAALAPLEP